MALNGLFALRPIALNSVFKKFLREFVKNEDTPILYALQKYSQGILA